MSFMQSFFGTRQQATDSSAIDIVTYLASLASNPKAIDSFLDSLREITARIQPGQPLSDADLTTLAQIFQKIEHYLLTQDPLRTFDKPGLETKIHQRFPNPNPAEGLFWSQITTSLAHSPKENDSDH